MDRIYSWLKSPVGFSVFVGGGGWGVWYLFDVIGSAKAAEVAKSFWAIYAFISAFHLKIITDLYGLRDIAELNGNERREMRSIVTRNVNRIWLFVGCLILMAIAGVLASTLVDAFGESAIWLAWMGVVFAGYSMLLVPGWNQEISEFRTTLFERKQREERVKRDLDAISAKPQDWVESKKLSQFVNEPPKTAR